MGDVREEVAKFLSQMEAQQKLLISTMLAIYGDRLESLARESRHLQEELEKKGGKDGKS
ncbi:hypothetical protein N1496_07900 [Streptococcus didelphis]|uniref:Transposase n=2 Tax=Streptococcus didelphis TaxID=102886 RepID=A0ABY9LGB5_9STRE|nr:hypothetical protein [Streptococcus didelphis]WMB27931.1 hypothetical protein N1496_07900 [Streptococcus didelphis]